MSENSADANKLSDDIKLAYETIKDQIALARAFQNLKLQLELPNIFLEFIEKLDFYAVKFNHAYDGGDEVEIVYFNVADARKYLECIGDRIKTNPSVLEEKFEHKLVDGQDFYYVNDCDYYHIEKIKIHTSFNISQLKK